MEDHAGTLRDVVDVSVLGGINVDVIGRSERALVPGTSNPGTTRVAAGGVGRNIAENLGRLELRTVLLGAVGPDAFGKRIRSDLEALGVDCAWLHIDPEGTGTYLAILDADGELTAAVADMGPTERLASSYVDRCRLRLVSSRLLIMDSNLTAEALARASHVAFAAGAGGNGSLLAMGQCSSSAKAPRFRAIGRPLDWMVCNRDEFNAITDRPIEEPAPGHDHGGALKAANGIASRIANNWCVTDGKNDVVHLDSRTGRIDRVAVAPVPVADATGAGDAFTAGLAFGLLSEKPAAEAIRDGIAAAALTLQCYGATSRELGAGTLRS